MLLVAACGRAVSVGQVPGATLTLVKQVVNTNGGTATAANWTLQAFGPVNLAGPGGSPQVTNQSVPIGTYDLRESGNNPGYVPGVWSCTGASASTTNSVTLVAGNNATCTITNSDTNVTTTTIATTTTQIAVTTTTSATNSTTTTTTISTTSSSSPPSSSVPSSTPQPPTGTLPAGLPPVR